MSDEKKLQVINLLAPHKSFFVALAEATTLHRVNKLVTEADPAKLKALLLLIHNCVTGLIPVPKSLVATLVRSKRMGTLRQRFELPTNFLGLLKAERKVKLQVLLGVKSSLGAFCRILT